MLRNRLYYSAKPYIPWKLRLALRRWHAKRILRRCGETWPILEAAGCPPEGWSGWPFCKRFAFVLTHDVESQVGLDRVKPLAELEMSLGFRSAFYFIPEGPYAVSPALRHWLTDHGFEVGVHDLHHDGELYRSRAHFRRCADKINRYLHDWNAVGFRSGFMFHNLDWLHDLNITYDASTFDTDPFEPQPDGVGTIFPFWVPARSVTGQLTSEIHPPAPGGMPASVPGPPASGSDAAVSELASQHSNEAPPHHGFVELPYTLPQDSTIFSLFEATSDDLWQQKLGWIVKHGGMALMNVHPDYLRFTSESSLRPGEFNTTLYAGFLETVQECYGAACLHELPREVAVRLFRHGDRGNAGLEPKEAGGFGVRKHQSP